MSQIESACSLLDAVHEVDRRFEMEDYEGGIGRWCSGCGDYSVLTAAQRLLLSEQLPPEQVTFISGIGCSSRFPHYMGTYGFHGIHGRALPLATGVKLARQDLHVFVVMGDGDCCSIGAAHWVHALRYNTDMVAMLLDNNIYGLTKKQTSPTTPQGYPSNTQPHGSFLPALNPLTVSLGVTNASFVAQTADWAPGHLYATLQAAHRHNGFAFIRILQRCPKWTGDIFEEAVRKPAKTELLIHPKGIRDGDSEKIFTTHVPHDPADVHAARELAEDPSRVLLGLFYYDPSRPVYNEIRKLPAHTAEEKIEILDEEMDRYAV